MRIVRTTPTHYGIYVRDGVSQVLVLDTNIRRTIKILATHGTIADSAGRIEVLQDEVDHVTRELLARLEASGIEQ
jgi:hypothetical protein